MKEFTKGATLAIYKERGALNVQFAPAAKNEKGYYEPGGFMISIAAPAADGTSKYDFRNSLKIFIRAEETTKFVKMIRDQLAENTYSKISFYHDPDKGTTQEGTRAKKLNVGAARDDGKFLNMEVGAVKASVVLNVDEIAYIATAMTYAIPSCLGWTFTPAVDNDTSAV